MQPSTPTSDKELKARRLAEALRANLQRRKQAVGGHGGTSPAAGDRAPETPAAGTGDDPASD